VIESTTTLSTAVEELQTESGGETDTDDGTNETDADDGTNETDGDDATNETDTDDATTGDEAPGFGVVAALIAAIAAALIARRP